MSQKIDKSRQNWIGFLVELFENLRYDSAPSGSLAQLVEHRAFNPMVIGSNPIRPTTYKSYTLQPSP